ncbi:diguanylate cyclase [bacterium]|nr:diguanylate cyclase [bacterium]MBU1993547.1 diguanylate cyclase [bacterium]
MNRILIVESNKALAKLIAKKINAELHFEVDIAHNFSEAKLFMHKYSYFIVLTDINLTDAPNGEIIDYALQKKIRVIVLSANIDKNLRKAILKKNIIDYVNKGSVEDINYIIQTLKRIQKNQNHKVLVVDDSMVFRKQMKEMLENSFFQVITVAHGEEALCILQTNPDISLVLTDYNMPVMDGLELTREIRKLYNKNALSLIAMSSNTDDEATALFLKHGANDFITKPFSKEEFSCRVNNSIEALENIHIITNHTDRDFLTGLYNRRYFFNNMKKYFFEAMQRSENFVIAMVSIDNFKKLNETYGHEAADTVIVHLSEILRCNTNQQDTVARFAADEFCIVLKNISLQDAALTLEHLKETVLSHVTFCDDQEIRFSISIGATIHHEDTLEESVNQADMMLYNAKQAGINQLILH